MRRHAILAGVIVPRIVPNFRPFRLSWLAPTPGLLVVDSRTHAQGSRVYDNLKYEYLYISLD